jgi:Fe-S-cluster containining protein
MARFATEPPLDDLLAALAEVYRDADAQYAGWSCPSSTECCRFGITGREPYVTSIELAAVKKAIRARGGNGSWKRALPLARDERTCPLLDAAGRCSIYASRPLGCRTFYCDRAEQGGKVKQRDINALVRRIQDIAQKHEPGGDKGRPLTRAL